MIARDEEVFRQSLRSAVIKALCLVTGRVPIDVTDDTPLPPTDRRMFEIYVELCFKREVMERGKLCSCCSLNVGEYVGNLEQREVLLAG